MIFKNFPINALENEIETKSIRWLELLEKEEQ